MADPFWLRVLRFAPRNLLSRAFGVIAGLKRPRWLVGALNRFWVRQFGVDVAEAARPLAEYESLLAFFTRELRPGARAVDVAADALVSPVDAYVGAHGAIEHLRLLQAKGMDYSLAALLGSDAAAAAFAHGHYLTLYLSPKDYHRIHAPRAGAITRTLYEPGTLWPVNAQAVRVIPALFAVNERVTTWLETDRGPLALVMVGATNVGSIRVTYLALATNRGGTRRVWLHDPALPVARGAHVGTFELGSTVVLLVADAHFAWEGLVEGAWLPMGRVIGRFAARAAPSPAQPSQEGA